MLERLKKELKEISDEYAVELAAIQGKYTPRFDAVHDAAVKLSPPEMLELVMYATYLRTSVTNNVDAMVAAKKGH